MFTAKIIAITFLSSFFGIFVVEYLEGKPQLKIILKTLLLIFIFFSIYNLIAGLNLWFGWEDPLSKATPEHLGRTSARRGGGLVLLVISFLISLYVPPELISSILYLVKIFKSCFKFFLSETEISAFLIFFIIVL